MRVRPLLRPLAAALALATVGACSAGPEPSTGAAQSAPVDPGKSDSSDAPGYALDGLRTWYLVGDALTPGDDQLAVTVTAPTQAKTVDLWIDGKHAKRLTRSGNVFSTALDITGLGVGKHRLLFAANGSNKAFAARDLVRSHPLYVFVSNDWDDPDNEDATLERQERLHAEHPELVLTHFVGPYTFTDPTTSKQRADELAAWVRNLRDTRGDEIGLHIHPYCSFVESAGVDCKTSPSFAKPYSDPSGYTVILSSYDKQQMSQLLEHADVLFAQNGLGKPTSFRAGGWTAEAHTLEALAENGFVADSSAANWHHMEEWKGVAGAALYGWCSSHWSEIDALSQPYYPSLADIQKPGAPFIPLLELPDNGLLVDYVSAQEMIGVFQQNWDGGALAEPRVVSIGYHPPNFSESFFARIDGALDEIDAHLASRDAGPVVYATASGLAKVFPQPTE